jgi:endonuclease YncB( thermonuclease family)
MPFTLIQGTFHLVGKSHSGNPTGFEPDGDSMQFAPNDRSLLDRLQVLQAPARLTSIGSTQLRFEGIDALELHFEGAHQPRPLADESRDFLTEELGMNPVPYEPPDDLKVKPPVEHDGTAGFILSRALEIHGRPVSFVFAGDPPQPDGSEVTLGVDLLKESLNFKSLRAGESYPLFYDTLFVDLRTALTEAAAAAREAGLGLWAEDRSQTGVPVTDAAGLEENGFTFPKLFRRLIEFSKAPAGEPDFLTWLATKREQVLDLTTHNFTHFDNVVQMTNDGVALARRPEELVFISAKTTDTHTAPWVAPPGADPA